jgi:hypothetical protein
MLKGRNTHEYFCKAVAAFRSRIAAKNPLVIAGERLK